MPDTLSFDFDVPTAPTQLRRVAVKSHLQIVRAGSGETAPFVKGSATSQAAAEAVVASGSAETSRGRVLAALVTFWPMTDQQIIERTGLSGDTVRPRRGELHRRGLIQPAGEGRTKSNRAAVIWEAVG